MQPLCVTSPGRSTCLLSTKGPLREEDSSSDQHQHRRNLSSILKCFTTSSLLAATLTLSTPSYLIPPASLGQLMEVQKGAALFQKACIGCHDMGGNILQPGATLFMKDLERNNVTSVEGIYNITYYGKGRMPGFGEKCTPRGQCTFGPRLHEDEIKMLAEFVKSQAEKGWPNFEGYGD